MEANLNQFRLLTVEGEQKANDQRRGPSSPDGCGLRRSAIDNLQGRLKYGDYYYGGSSGERVRKSSVTPSSDRLSLSHQPLPHSSHEPAICNFQDTDIHHSHHCSSQSRPSRHSLSSRPQLQEEECEEYDEDDSHSSKPSLAGSDESYMPQFNVKNSTSSDYLQEGEATEELGKKSNKKDVTASKRSSRVGSTVLENVKEVSDDESTPITDPHLKLEKAIKSLDKTMTLHCQLLAKRVGRERQLVHQKTVGEIRHRPSQLTFASIAPKPNVRVDKVTVYMRVIFLKIGEIDTMKENFMADAFIQARWREPALDLISEQFATTLNVDEIDWDKFWNPKLYVENNLGEPKETIWQTVSFGLKGEATVYERRRIKGCFLENLELDDFPFDTQDLTLTITSERADTELELEEDNIEISSINVQSFVDEQEWALHSHVETWKCITSKIFQNSKLKHPSFSTSCRASRRAGFYIWNIFLVMLFICSLTFATFSVELTKPENRLQLSFILLLTTITFKFVVSQTLPRISYLTYLDKYILTSMGILCGVCVWHAIIPLFKYDIELAKIIDKWGLVVSSSSYFIFHVVFFLYIYIMALKKRWKYDQKDRDHKERVRKLQLLQDQQTKLILEASIQCEEEKLSLSQENQSAEWHNRNSSDTLFKDHRSKQEQATIFDLGKEPSAKSPTDQENESKPDNLNEQNVLQIYRRQASPLAP